WIAMLAALVAGLLAGFVTGILHTFMGIPAILAGILTQLILWSVNLKVMGKANIALPNRKYELVLAQIKTVQSILILLVFVAFIVAALYYFFGTELGASVRATGNNLNMSRAQGINTDLNKILGLTLSNGIVALSGALLTQYQGFADINMGRGAIVIGLAAVIIGEAIVSHISQNLAARLIGVVLGGVIYYFVYQTVIFLGLDADLLKMLSALVVAIFLAIPYWKKKYFAKAKGGRANA
ncbi:MAG: ABC transporter permease, partial [Acutalibacteraceae bacterium]